MRRRKMKNKGLVTLFRVLICMVIVAEVWGVFKGIFDVIDADYMKGGEKFYQIVCVYLLGCARDLILPIFCYVFMMFKLEAPILPVGGGAPRYPMQGRPMPPQGMAPMGGPQGMPPQGMPPMSGPQGMPPQGMPQQPMGGQPGPNQQWPPRQ